MFFVVEIESGQVLFDNLDSGHAAARLARAWQETTNKKAGVRIKNNPEWENRELARFESGDYLPVAWHDSSFWRNNEAIHKLHYAHRSKVKDHCIAYTESPEKGSQDRQTRIKAGAYLTKYFSHILSESEINHYARLHASIENTLDSEVKFTSDPDLIEEIYIHGPQSCMSDPASSFSGHCHPVKVYGDSDLQLAYVDRQSDYHNRRYAARALVWPEKKIYGRVYPTPERYSDNDRIIARAEYNGLIMALEKLGYQSGRFDGAKIKAIEDSNDNGYIMPYLDGTQGVDLVGEYFVIHGNGDYSADQTNGLMGDNKTTCQRCEESVDPDDTSIVQTRHVSETWCCRCTDYYSFYCEGYGDLYDSDSQDSVCVDGNTYSLRYAEHNFYFCERSEEWTKESCRTVNTKHGTEEWCESEVEDHAFLCEKSDSLYSSDDFESVTINGITYEKSNAYNYGLLETETESETI
jgi:hypothetical protein